MTLTCWENEKAGLLIKLTTEFKQCVNDFSLSLQLPCTPTNSRGPLVGSPSASLGLWQKNPHWHPISLIAFALCSGDDRHDSATTSQFSTPPRTFHFNYTILFYFLAPLCLPPVWMSFSECHICPSVAISFGFSKASLSTRRKNLTSFIRGET